MMTFEDKKAAERAYVRAQIEKPRLREIRFGRYEGTSQAGDRQYSLEYRKQAGKLIADCSCPAGRKNSTCKHALAAYAHYKMRVNERAAAAALALAAPAGYLFLPDEDIASGQWTGPMTEQEATRAGKCASKWCDRPADGLSSYCEDCALENASAYADIMDDMAG